MSLIIRYGRPSKQVASRIEGSPGRWNCDGSWAWRVAFEESDGRYWFIPMMFARKRDAELAMASLQKIHDWQGSLDDTISFVRQYGKDDCTAG